MSIQHWDSNVPYNCPNCKEVFDKTPKLLVNTFISEMAAQFRQSAQQEASSSSEQQAAKPGEVPCDVCTGTKLKALKSCLVCLESYCESHLEPHMTRPGLKKHQLIDPVENLAAEECSAAAPSPSPVAVAASNTMIAQEKSVICSPQIGSISGTVNINIHSGTQDNSSSSSSEQQAAKPGEVLCDACTGTKLKALKSCLVCQESYCLQHLEPHMTRPGLKRHQLIDPVENLEERMCKKHDKPLELFCKTDQTCVCKNCTSSDHQRHDVVPLKEEYEGKKAELGKTEAEVQQMIQKRRLKIQEMRRSVKLSEEAADREIVDGVQVFTALKESVERSLMQLIHTIEEKQRETETQAEGLIKELEQEISDLEKRSTEVKQLSQSEDHHHLLLNFLSLTAAPTTKNWTEISVRPPSYEGTVERAAKQLEEQLSEQMKKLFEEELKRVQQYAVDVTLDPDTAHPDLILSDDGKQVKDSDVTKNLPNNPERFDTCPCVLSRQSFSSGRFYYEVQVEGKTEWGLGVARESINRKGRIKLSTKNGYWTIWLRNDSEYKAAADRRVPLSLKSRPQKVGVFVDHEEGLVSFYDVDTAALIYSYTGCSFTEKLYPYFCPCSNDGGKNSAPLIISPVNQTE